MIRAGLGIHPLKPLVGAVRDGDPELVIVERRAFENRFFGQLEVRDHRTLDRLVQRGGGDGRRGIQ